MYKKGSKGLSDKERRQLKGDYYHKFVIGTGHYMPVRLCSDKSICEGWIAKLDSALIRKSAREPIDPKKLEGIPRRILKSLGLVNRLAEGRKAPWDSQVDDYVAELKTAGRTKVYVENVDRTLKRIGKKCKWLNFDSINRESLSKYFEERRKDDAAPRTINNEVSLLKSFLGWAERVERIDRNPLTHIGRVDETADRRRVRRALTEDECKRLLKVSKKREPCYRVALGTGLRKRELKLLEWRDVRIDSENPHLSLRPEATKSKRADVIPLSPQLADLLRRIKPEAAKSTDKVLQHVPVFMTCKNDLERAGIPYTDEQGRIAGIHSLRVTYITNLSNAGLPTRVVMALARHTDPKLTMGTYTDMSILKVHLEVAVEKLPNYETGDPKPVLEPLRKTGTTDISDTVDPVQHQNQYQNGTKKSQSGARLVTSGQDGGGWAIYGSADVTLLISMTFWLSKGKSQLPGTGVEPALRLTETRPST